MTRFWVCAALLPVLLFASTPATSAEPIRKHFEALKAERKKGPGSDKSGSLMILGAGMAFMMANAELARRKQPRMYCQPAELSLNVDNVVDIAVKEYERNPALYDDNPHGRDNPLMTMVTALLEGLKTTFPCK